MHHNPEIYLGTSGIQLPTPKYLLSVELQASTRLTLYSKNCNSVEINSSFYKIPLANTVAKWANEVPESFKFTFKLWRGITHEKNLQYKEEYVHQFLKIISKVDNKKGCLLIQFPASITAYHQPSLFKLIEFIDKIDPHRQWKLAVEFRHQSWYTNEIARALHQQQVTLVLHDMPGAATPISLIMGNTVYLRFHGPTGDYHGTYDYSTLQQYATYVKEWIALRKRVFVYFNNTAGNALENLNTFSQSIHSQK